MLSDDEVLVIPVVAAAIAEAGTDDVVVSGFRYLFAIILLGDDTSYISWYYMCAYSFESSLLQIY